MPRSPQEVLRFWFDPAVQAHWFASDDVFDEQVRQRFGDTLDAAVRGELESWADTPEGWLALLIVLDQFSRNIHRGDARAWSADAASQALALAGIARGDDQRLIPLQRLFVYLPLEHAEDVALQHRSVQLFERLANQQPDAAREPYLGFLDYARRHRDVIHRFGRFPHRNALLGRDSTPDEQAYLDSPGSGF